MPKITVEIDMKRHAIRVVQEDARYIERHALCGRYYPQEWRRQIFEADWIKDITIKS